MLRRIFSVENDTNLPRLLASLTSFSLPHPRSSCPHPPHTPRDDDPYINLNLIVSTICMAIETLRPAFAQDRTSIRRRYYNRHGTFFWATLFPVVALHLTRCIGILVTISYFCSREGPFSPNPNYTALHVDTPWYVFLSMEGVRACFGQPFKLSFPLSTRVVSTSG